MSLAPRHLSVHAAIAGNVNRYGAPKSRRLSISRMIASGSLMRSAIFSHTRKTKFGSAVTCRNWTHTSVAMTSSTGSPPSATTTPARNAGSDVKRGRAEQRTAAQKREDAILRQYKSRRWRLSDKKQILVKHHRERSEVALRFQAANGVGYPDHQPRVSGYERQPLQC